VPQLRGQARLADARVAGQQNEPPGARARLLEQPVELADLRAAPDERVALGQYAERRRPGVRLHCGRRRDGRRRLATQQPLVDGHRRRAGHRPELLAQQRAQLLECPQGLGRVAGRLVDLHQQDVSRLAERRHRDGRAGGLLGGAEIAPALAQAGQRDRLQAAQADRVELAALLVQPRAVAVGQEARAVDARRRPAVGECGRPVAALERRLGFRRLGLGALDVDADIGTERQLDAAATPDHALAERPAQLRQQRAQRRVGRRRRALGPQSVDQLGARADAVAVAHQVREEQATLAARDSVLQSAASERDPDGAAKPYLPATFYGHRMPKLPGRQRFSKLSPTAPVHHALCGCERTPDFAAAPGAMEGATDITRGGKARLPLPPSGPRLTREPTANAIRWTPGSHRTP
jgi:hypothetical protein